jgi:hypothetical protein
LEFHEGISKKVFFMQTSKEAGQIRMLSILKTLRLTMPEEESSLRETKCSDAAAGL